ncbi:MAG: radical SAM protein [Gemmatimonadales bacterium]
MRSSKSRSFTLDDRWVLAHRGSRNEVDPARPYAYFVERERTSTGEVVDVASIFITNKECPFRCVMCDLWKNTTIQPSVVGAVPDQIEWALERLPPVKHVKLYNSGNFFDARAIPRDDWPRIIALVSELESVIIECHPRLVDERAEEFAHMLEPELQVAMGLETVDPAVLPRLNKRMTLQDYETAAELLLAAGISVRAFILLKTPFQNEQQGVDWAKRSLDYAFSIGVDCCVVIPTRPGNGAMERLASQGLFTPPAMRSVERVLEYGVGLGPGRTFADLWDIEKLLQCPTCAVARRERLAKMNLTQVPSPPIDCDCGT